MGCVVWRNILGGWDWIDNFYGCVWIGAGVFRVGGSGWTFYLGRLEWVGVNGGIFWVGWGGEHLWVGGSALGWLNVYLGWLEMSVYFYELVGLGGDWCRYILVEWGGWTFFMGGWGYLRVGGGIFWVGWSGWTFFMSRWGWVVVYFEWVGVGDNFLWVEAYFGWVEVGGHIYG